MGDLGLLKHAQVFALGDKIAVKRAGAARGPPGRLDIIASAIGPGVLHNPILAARTVEYLVASLDHGA